MSLSILRKNFYHIITLIIDYGADSMRCVLDQFIEKKYRVSFKDFVSNHQHEIYHKFSNHACCQCSKNYQLPCKQVLSIWQMESLFDNNGTPLPSHQQNSKSDYCCSIVKHTLVSKDIDITLLRFFLVSFFEEEFWQNCLTGRLSFEDFLNENKHDIFHLVRLNTPCCLCTENQKHITMVQTAKDRLTKFNWETLFALSNPHCTHNKTCVDEKNPCSVAATRGICQSILDGRARITILSNFCMMMKHTDNLVNTRNTVIAHAIKGEISDGNFTKLWNEIEKSIIYLSKITGTDIEQSQKMLELKAKSPNEDMCFEIQSLALRKMQEDENIIQVIQQSLKCFLVIQIYRCYISILYWFKKVC